MAKKSVLTKLMNLLVWLTGVLVSLAVGSGMINQVLVVGWIPEIVTVVAGWIVVVSALLGVVLAIANQ